MSKTSGKTFPVYKLIDLGEEGDFYIEHIELDGYEEKDGEYEVKSFFAYGTLILNANNSERDGTLWVEVNVKCKEDELPEALLDTEWFDWEFD